MIVNSEELCEIIEHHASINWYIWRSIVSRNLRKEYLNMAIFKISLLLLILYTALRHRGTSFEDIPYSDTMQHYIVKEVLATTRYILCQA